MEFSNKSIFIRNFFYAKCKIINNTQVFQIIIRNNKIEILLNKKVNIFLLWFSGKFLKNTYLAIKKVYSYCIT